MSPPASSHDGSALPYLAFARRHPRPLAFGGLLTFSSSLGQTFLISLFVPDLLRAFALDNGRFGALYAAATRVVTSLWAGALVDRFGALRLVPYALVPICAGLALLGAGASPWVAFAYLGLAGTSLGLASPLSTALWAEVFGVRSLGATKGTLAMASVAATAAGPVAFGALLDAGVSFETLLSACTALGAASVLLDLISRAVLARSPLAGLSSSPSRGGSRP